MTTRLPAATDVAWVKALVDAYARRAPIFDAVCRDLGNPLSVETRAALEAGVRVEVAS